jgi:MoaA/NifB/PqqE/SkfB family radical SAM enzyme
MKALFLLVNSMCDIACKYCFYTTGHEKRSRYRVRPEIADQVVEKIASVGFNAVILSGGDPLHSQLKHETFMLVRKLKARGLKVIINTSATRLGEDDFDTIISLEVDRMDVSIDSYDAAIHDAQRGCHADVVSGITALLRKGYCNVATTTVVTNLNASKLLDTIIWLRELGVEDVRIQRAFLPGNVFEADHQIVQAMHDAEPFLRASHTHKYIELTENAFKGQSAPCLAQCRMGKEYFVCNARGILTPCFHREKIVLGNLFKDPADMLIRNLECHELEMYDVPPCFGSHCASLFDIPTFWRR